MGCRRWAFGVVLVACGTASQVSALAQTMPEIARPPAEMVPTDGGERRGLSPPSSPFVTPPVPLDALPPAVRERVRTVLDRPTLSSRGPLEAFHCRPALYYWLLDHPDLAVRLWRGLGAKCTDIQLRGEGRFGWQDAQGGEVHWETVLRSPRQRVWYAEGKVRPGVMLPAVPVQAVVVLNHQEGSDGNGRQAIRHQMDLILHTDSRAVKLAARLFGASAPRIAEEYVGQMEMFFGALAWYLTQHPDKAAALFEELKRPAGAPGPRGAAPPAPEKSVPRGHG